MHKVLFYLILTYSIFLFKFYRFKSLEKPLDHRRNQLEEDVALYSFYHDVDLELTWIAEHEPVTDTSSYTKSLAGAISLLQNHKVEQIAAMAHNKIHS